MTALQLFITELEKISGKRIRSYEDMLSVLKLDSVKWRLSMWSVIANPFDYYKWRRINILHNNFLSEMLRVHGVIK